MSGTMSTSCYIDNYPKLANEFINNDCHEFTYSPYFLYIHGVLQATLTDRAVGGFLVGLALAIFVYYTLWVMVLVRFGFNITKLLYMYTCIIGQKNNDDACILKKLDIAYQ